MEIVRQNPMTQAKKLLKNKDIKGFFEVFFHLYECKQGADADAWELEAWTVGGVDMIITVEVENALKEFKEYVNDFDIEHEIELNRQDKSYREAFTLREALNDFEKYHKWLKKIVAIIDKFA